jgi:hypothetical protein
LVGVLVGEFEGVDVGEFVGLFVGLRVGVLVGLLVGELVGAGVTTIIVGASVGVQGAMQEEPRTQGVSVPVTTLIRLNAIEPKIKLIIIQNNN